MCKLEKLSFTYQGSDIDAGTGQHPGVQNRSTTNCYLGMPLGSNHKDLIWVE